MNFEVMIVGSDINAYYLARCCYEAYHKKAYVLAKEKRDFTHYSKILNIIYDKNIWHEKVFIRKLNELANNFLDKKILLISSNETYAEFIVKNKKNIAKNYIFNYPDFPIFKSFIDKKEFYQKYHQKLDLPKTYIYNVNQKEPLNINLRYPLIIKPADVVSYNHLDFLGKCKIYKINNKQELNKTITILKKSGYEKDLIIQEYIPGDDSHLFDSVVYVSQNHQVEFISFAQIGLQEHNQNLVGNAAVLINGYNSFKIDNKSAIKKVVKFLEEINYQGFAEIDWKYDARDKTFKILEINARQGRSSYYITNLGCNLIKILIDDLINKKQVTFKVLEKEVLLSFVPKKIIKKYIENKEYQKEALKLWAKREVINPVKCKLDKHFWRIYLYVRKYFYYLKDYKHSYWLNK